MLQELRVCFGRLPKTPGFTAAVILTLALGIGANTTIFSVVNAVLLNRDGISNPERVVSARARYDNLNLRSILMSVRDFANFRDSHQLFEYAASRDEKDFNSNAGTMPERLERAAASTQYFDVFGTKPQLDRVFLPSEDEPNADQEEVLASAAWKRRSERIRTSLANHWNWSTS